MKTWFRIYLIVSSIGGGLLGGTLVLLHAQAGAWSKRAITFSALEMYAFVTVSGCIFALDWRKGHLLLIALALQVPYISSEIVTYRFGAGFHFFILAGPGYIGFDTLVGSRFSFGYTNDSPWRVGINIVALAALLFLFRTLNAYEQKLKSTPAILRAGSGDSDSEAHQTHPYT